MGKIITLLLLVGFPIHAEIMESKVTEGTLTPATPPKPVDRMEGSKAAAKAAAAGAALGKVNCMMMMNEARKKDDKMMMMLAQQQCQQASELEKSAQENDKGRKALSMDDVPKQAKFEAGKFELKESSVKEEKLSFDDTVARAEPTATSEIELPEAFIPDLSKPAEPVGDLLNQVADTARPPATALAPVAAGKLEMDDSAKPINTAPMMGSVGGLPQNSRMESSGADGANDSDAATGKQPARGIASDPGPGLAASGDSERSDSSKGNGEEAFDALMAELMGDQAEGEGYEIAGGQVLDGSSGAATNRANIFEYAAIRYARLVKETKTLGGPKSDAPPARAIARAANP